MSQSYDPTKPASGSTNFGALYQIIRDHIAAATSNFSGTAFPASPVAGQPCYRTDRLTTNGVPKLYIYTALPSFGESGWVEVSANSVIGEELVNARGTKSSLDQRLDVALNEDGTLKASTTLNPSQWYLPSLTFTYLSTTSFKVNGDQTDIYKAARRLKINLNASTVYSEVVSASYSAPDTTIQISDAVLDNTLVSVEHSLFLPDWDNKSAVSPRMAGNRRVKTVTADYTTTLNDEIILVDASGAARTITVLAAATLGPGRRQQIIKIDNTTNAVTIDPNGSETINGNATLAITVPLTGLEYESDGTNLRTVDDQTAKITAADILSDFVVSGLLGTDPGASLTMTIPAGVAYVMGRRVVKLAGASDLTRTYTASKDTFVDISHVGAITYSEVANGAGAPSVAANSLRLMKVVTNGTEITGVTDMRVLTGSPFRGVLAAQSIGQELTMSKYARIGFNLTQHDTDNIRESFSKACTISIASPAVITCTAHGLTAGQVVRFETTGALPTGLLTNWRFYVLSTGLTADTFQVSGSVDGTAVNTSGTQSGSHTIIRETRFYIPAGISKVRFFVRVGTVNTQADKYFQLSLWRNGNAYELFMHLRQDTLTMAMSLPGPGVGLLIATPPVNVTPGDYYEAMVYNNVTLTNYGTAYDNTAGWQAYTYTYFGMEIIE